jgi:hypothetical protein
MLDDCTSSNLDLCYNLSKSGRWVSNVNDPLEVFLIENESSKAEV